MHFYIGERLVLSGEHAKDFKGERWKFLYITRESEPGKSGKVLMRRGDWTQEFYPTVFGGEIK